MSGSAVTVETTALNPSSRDEPRIVSDSSGQSASRGATVVVDPDGEVGRAFATAVGAVELADDFSGPIERAVVFLPRSPSVHATQLIDRCVAMVERNPGCCVCLVSSFRIHLGDQTLQLIEDETRATFESVTGRTVVLRAGNIVATDGQLSSGFARLAQFRWLIPSSVTSVFLNRDELFAAIDAATSDSGEIRSESSGRTLTVLGSNRPLRDVLAEFGSTGGFTTVVSSIAWLLSCLQIDRVIAGLFAVAGWIAPASLRRWRLTTLEPASVSELLTLVNPLNQQHVALAGYNTGVVHFGWKYPGKTVVRTTSSGRLVRVRDQVVNVDAGVLLKRLIGELRERDRELFVVPNYSYISAGTTFMVPVHGSGSEVSTLGDTIERTLIYDPQTDRLRLIRRGDEDFGRLMYNSASGVLVLRLQLRIRERSRYFVQRSELQSPSAADIWQAFADPEASNIELRKSKATDSSVEVSRYFTTPSDDQATMEVPRDSIGRLWDRLEENPVSSWLFHAFVRKCGFHVELFLNETEFEVFWRAHATLPLSKIQLRLVKADGLSNSPFGDCDRISADTFMKRKNSAAFLKFMQENLPDARFNPGKHSM